MLIGTVSVRTLRGHTSVAARAPCGSHPPSDQPLETQTIDPTKFQGHGRTRNYFEGWYFKIVVPDQGLAYAFIPGVSYGADGGGHAFLQVLNGTAATSAYHEYPTEAFVAARDRLHLRLGPHEFATDRLRVDLPRLGVDLRFDGLHPWRKRWYAPGIMGPFGFVPRMQCYHGLVSYHHRLRGTVTVDGVAHDAAGGVGYTEKDWGSGFPRAWVWCQSNHLSGTDQPASLMASVAHIPWLGTSFTGFLATFLLEGKTYLFTTWARAQVRCKFGEQGEVDMTFTKGKYRLQITGTPAPGGDLASPVTGAAMTGKINESLRAELSVRFWTAGRLSYDGTAAWAGLEVSDQAPRLLAD